MTNTLTLKTLIAKVASAAALVTYNASCTVPNPSETKIEFDHTILCNPTGQQVLVVTNYSAVGIPTVTYYYNMNGSAYTGSLVLKSCNSDPKASCETRDSYKFSCDARDAAFAASRAAALSTLYIF